MTTSRNQLKLYFSKNAIPTEGQFAELIDAPLNQADDGVFKETDKALAIVAASKDPQKPVLRLYADFKANETPNPDWMICLNPKDPRDSTKSAVGFGIVDGAGNTRLMISRGGDVVIQGNVEVTGSLGLKGAASLGPAKIQSNFNEPLMSGFYVMPRPLNDSKTGDGGVPDATHPWVHLLALRHCELTNHHQLQLASSFSRNDRLYFRKLGRMDLEADNESQWQELATRGGNTFNGTQVFRGRIDADALFVNNDAVVTSATELKICDGTLNAGNTRDWPEGGGPHGRQQIVVVNLPPGLFTSPPRVLASIESFQAINGRVQLNMELSGIQKSSFQVSLKVSQAEDEVFGVRLRWIAVGR